MPRGLTNLFKSMTGVLQYIGFGRSSAPTVAREQRRTDAVRGRDARALHEQVHEPERPRLERGHPKR